MRRIMLLTCAAAALSIFGCTDKPSSPTTTDTNSPVTTLTELGWPDSMTGRELNPSFANSDWMPDDSLWKYDIIMVTIAWGNPVPANTPTDPAIPTIDWSGGLWINGVIHLDPRMLISFEPAQDSLIVDDTLLPVRWISSTTGDIDGLTLAMYVDKTVIYIVEPQLHFVTVQDTIAWSLSELYRFDSVYVLDNSKMVAIHSRKVEQPCLQGLMTGEWIKDDAWHGVYHGVWGGPMSDLQGRLHGKFWTTDDGRRVLDGEWVAPTSNLVGRIKGRWEYFDPTMCPMCGEGHGYFMGTVTFPENTDKPIRLVGEFGSFGQVSDSLRFRGRWQVICNTSAIGDTE